MEADWLWGWDHTPGIVSVCAEVDGHATVWRRIRETGALVRDEERYRPWLLLECLDRALEADLRTVTLEVRPSNLRAQDIYRRFGFQQVGIHRRYYANNGEDALVMLTPDLATPEQRARLDAVRAEVLARFPEVDWLKALPEARGGEVGA